MQNKYFDDGFRIISIHSNEFDNLAKWFSRKEPTINELISFTDIFRLNFEIYKTILVNGEDAHPLFKFLKKKLDGFIDNSIKWNFSKFLIHKNGTPYKRFSPTDNPFELENDIIYLLNPNR